MISNTCVTITISCQNGCCEYTNLISMNTAPLPNCISNKGKKVSSLEMPTFSSEENGCFQNLRHLKLPGKLKLIASFNCLLILKFIVIHRSLTLLSVTTMLSAINSFT